MLSIVIVGTGNVANHLFNAFTKSKEVKVVQVVGRNQDALKSFGLTSAISSDFAQIADADIYLVAVSDSAIASVSKLLAKKSGIVAHTSGTVEMDIIGLENCGVFYPLQTFTKGKTLDFTAIPICIEARHESALSVLRRLGNLISDNIHEIDSNKRKRLHLAAVFANNFTNHLYSISEKICEQEDLPFELLQPLILETAEKVQSISPREAQTGPARRNDKKTLEIHLNLLKDEKQTELYALFSEAIKKMYEEEL
nr:Rossmann-like and DUF2520 domain-containing protein [uncultured Allomuricauda sp.]